MINIRPAQIKVFEDQALNRFENEMIVHSKEFSPELCEALGDEQLRVAIRQALKRANSYGFTNRGPLRLYIELMFYCGSEFDSDPQYIPLAKILNDPADQMQRAEQLYQNILNYQEKVSGLNALNEYQALEAMLLFARMPVTVNPDNFEKDMLQELFRVYPQKSSYIGQDNLNKLIQKGRSEAEKYGFSTIRGETMMVMLMFGFGHGCTSDPLYPWIMRTVTDESIIDSEARAKRLEKKATTWLENVLSKLRKGDDA